MGRYDTVRCAQIRELIEENQYLAAMREIEELDFNKVPTITDLYLFADVFLRAEKMDVAKELYYTAYHRTASRPALYRLLMLVIRMGDIEEAKELYLAYEIIAGMTFDTYELKYRLAKAEGQPREALIQILEQLKKEEYTEEWGYQLARLYELEGKREKCIEECEDIVRWFGAGTIVKKAMELKERCMSPSWVRPVEDEIPEPEVPDLEEEPVRVAHAPVAVEEIKVETVPQPESEIQEEATTPQEPVLPKEKTPEVQEEPALQKEEIPEVQEKPAPQKEEEPAPVMQAEKTADAPDGESEETPQEEKPGILKRLVNYFKVDLDMFEEEESFPEELDTYKQQSTAEIDVKKVVAESVDEIAGQKEKLNPEHIERVAQMPSVEEALTVETKTVKPVRAPVESLEEKLREVEEKQKVLQMEETENAEHVQEVKSHPLGYATTGDIVEDVSPNGIRYNTLKGAIYKMHHEEGIINFALTGGAEGITLAVAKRLFKELKKINYFEAKNIGKISADKLDNVNLEEWAEKFIGGCMYIMDAPSLSSQSVKNLSALIEKYQKQIVIILEGSYDEMDSFLNFHKEFEQNITFKVKL